MADDQAGPGMSVLLLVDPGLPTRRARSVRARLTRELVATFEEPVTLEVRTQFLRIQPDDTLDLGEAARIREEYERVDVVLMLTEIPRHTHEHPLICEVLPEQSVAVISCPTLGVLASKRRIVRVLMDAALKLAAPTAATGDPARYEFRWSKWSRDESSGNLVLHAATLAGGPRTVLGMAMANDPLRTAPMLSSAMAAASATGAFGIFYNSIWQMSDHLSTARLGVIGLLAVVAMVGWLILSNRLWDRPRRRSLATVILLYNMSTVVSLFTVVLALFLALVVVILVAAVIVIDPAFMSSVIGGPVTFGNYLAIAWFSASMGVVAGGLGSSFDSKTDLRQLTHGQRERQRHYSEQELERQRQGDVEPGTVDRETDT